MTSLRVVPVRRSGGDRLCVNLPDGRTVAFYDQGSEQVCLLVEEHLEAVREALRPFALHGLALAPPPVPGPADIASAVLHPDDDLAPNRPGEHLLQQLGSRPRALLARLRGRAQAAALAAEEATGAVLDALEQRGVRTLHSVPLPGGERLHHLAVGPGGVLVVRALAARGRRVRVTGTGVSYGRRGPELPELRPLRAQAERAAEILGTPLTPVLALHEAAGFERRPAARDLQVLPAAELSALCEGSAVFTRAEVGALYGRVRDRRAWLRPA